ncbi:MAG: hypothetical protein WBD40_11465 [Tepidisphaeraceae bacterium]
MNGPRPSPPPPLPSPRSTGKREWALALANPLVFGSALHIVAASDAFRRQALFVAILFTLLATAVALWRSRFAVAVMLALVGVTVTAVHVWNSSQAPDPARMPGPAPSESVAQ